jgi:hypothetical protein
MPDFLIDATKEPCTLLAMSLSTSSYLLAGVLVIYFKKISFILMLSLSVLCRILTAYSKLNSFNFNLLLLELLYQYKYITIIFFQ